MYHHPAEQNNLAALVEFVRSTLDGVSDVFAKSEVRVDDFLQCFDMIGFISPLSLFGLEVWFDELC